MSARRFWAVIFTLIFFAQGLSLFIPVLSSDEMSWTMLAREIFSGDFYIRVSDNKPPFHFQLYWLSTLGGSSVLAMKIYLIASFFITAILLFRLALAWGFSLVQAQWTTVLFALFCGFCNNGAISGEKLLLPFLVCALLAAELSKQKYIWALISGAAIAAACNIKPTAGVFIPLIAVMARRPSAIILQTVGGLAFTFGSWKLVGTDFQTIFTEAVGVGYKYSSSFSQMTSFALKDLVGDALIMIGLWYLPLILLSFRAKNANAKLIWFLVCSFVSVAVGFRFYQQYFPILLPALAMLAALGFTNLKHKKVILVLCGALILAQHSFTLVREIKGQNRNWNPLVEEAIRDIKAVSQPGDTAWVTSSVYSLYVYGDLKPVAKYPLWLFYFNFADSCRAPDGTFVEANTNPNYDELLETFKATPPKLIFWTSRHENNCSDRFKLENFPKLKAFIDSSYRLEKSGPLGYLYTLNTKRGL